MNDNYNTYVEDGKKKLIEEDYLAAIDLFSKAVQLNPDRHEAYNCLGLCNFKLNKLPKALHFFEKVISMQPNNLPALNNLGLICQQSGKINEAIEYLKKALFLNASASTYMLLGICYTTKKEYNLAIKYLKKAEKIEP
ncbi:MAG: tetratricopeptide repeat protein [Vampirovibrionia bacterium]